MQLEDNVLNLHARIAPHMPADARLIHEEFRPGDYHRSFILSDEVDRERITAELKNGVLRVLLPKAERARTRRIEIKSPDLGTSPADVSKTRRPVDTSLESPLTSLEPRLKLTYLRPSF